MTFHDDMAAGYAATGATLPLGRPFADPGAPDTAVEVGIPLPLANRHGLIAGATGTGKTRTLQLLAEGLSAAGGWLSRTLRPRITADTGEAAERQSVVETRKRDRDVW